MLAIASIKLPLALRSNKEGLGTNVRLNGHHRYRFNIGIVVVISNSFPETIVQ